MTSGSSAEAPSSTLTKPSKAMPSQRGKRLGQIDVALAGNEFALIAIRHVLDVHMVEVRRIVNDGRNIFIAAKGVADIEAQSQRGMAIEISSTDRYRPNSC